jgi:hypothetical protein
MSTLVFPASVRDEVLRQHDELRGLLRDVMRAADMAAFEEPPCDRLIERGRELCLRFRDHLAFEDEWLKPVLAVLDSWGPERVRGLDEDHRRQRARIDDVLESMESSGDPAEMSEALNDLVEDLAHDMYEEELSFLCAPDMGAAMLTVERR